MNIHTAAGYLKVGYRIIRKGWGPHKDMWLDQWNVEILYLEDLLATDWEIDYRNLIDNSGLEPKYDLKENK